MGASADSIFHHLGSIPMGAYLILQVCQVHINLKWW
jgi:hypothetical protein